MGYRIYETVQRLNQDIALGVKSTFNGPGLFVSVYSTQEQGVNNLKNLLLTRIGERYDNPSFGTDLLNVLFAPATLETKIIINEMVSTAINRWLPEIILEKIDIQTPEDLPTLNNDIVVTLTFSVNGTAFQTLTLSANETGKLQIT
jgi:phage baseplate assembly protein W